MIKGTGLFLGAMFNLTISLDPYKHHTQIHITAEARAVSTLMRAEVLENPV